MEQAYKTVRERRFEVSRFVSHRVEQMQRGLLSESKSSNATRKLAMLRRAAGKEAGSVPEVWGVEFDGMPEDLVGTGEAPSKGEWAVHIALTLYAIHQQAQTVGMHYKEAEDGRKQGVGNAVKRFRYAQMEEQIKAGQATDLDEMPHRFAAMVTAESIEEFAHYARQVVQQLRTKSIGFNYGLFAGQVFEFQFSERADRVRLEWGREFAQQIASKNDKADTYSEYHK